MTYKLPEPYYFEEHYGLDIVVGYTADTLRREIAAAEKRGAAQREAELMAVGMEPDQCATDQTDQYGDTIYRTDIYSAEQLAAARLQGAVVNQGLLDCLKELRAALDPDDWMGEVTMHDFIDAAIAEAHTGG